MRDYQKVYEEQWKSIVEDHEGNLQKKQIQKQLAAYSALIENVSYVYGMLTPQRKVDEDPMIIIDYVNDTMINREMVIHDLEQMANYEGMISKEEIVEYLIHT
ncbi:hypothetical protein AB1K91_07055 [Terribacillus sp. 179-K 1B1 HS]|uniref:hypothetical protein n=1 Tax=Terribacillus sp. 179-K 1B1 HS TaxID=3142388 RepID=UPI00399F9561